jgi:hypothetical protein
LFSMAADKTEKIMVQSSNKQINAFSFMML